VGQPALEAGEKIRVVADLYARALAAPGFGQLASMLDEDAHLELGSRDIRGRERVVRAHEELFGAFDERSVATSRVLRTDRAQALEWTMTGVQARDWMGVAATRRPVVINGLTLLWTNDDGFISDLHVYLDEPLVKAQLGAGPVELQTISLAPPSSGRPEVYEQSGAPAESVNVRVVRAMLQALEGNQEAAFLSTLADDVEVWLPARAEVARGKDAARSYFKTMRTSIGDLDTVVQNIWGLQDLVVIEYSIAGMQWRPFGHAPFQQGRLIDARVAEIAEVRDGTIERVWRYDDSGALAAAMAAHRSSPTRLVISR